ncbi:MAG: HlyD family efflux transporter periplasmic adaptor subunit [Clostridiales bacterium]|nr:HlyD family efflux transporter periplasmic adaptor subunit [Clostridiales bacterium]
MKTKLSVFTALLLILTLSCASALGATANAVIVAPETAKVIAPFSGTLRPFDLTQGETVAGGDVLFEIDTIPVYAQQAGVVGAVLAVEGDDASGVISRHGAIAVIEPELALYIDADTDYAYDDDDNRYLHAGETLYLKCGNEKGVGRVTSVNGEDYIVEILEGAYDVGDTIRCFRESAMPSDSETGRGKAKRYPDVTVQASGRVAKVHVQSGDKVAVGDLLFEMIDAQSARDASPVISAPVSGAVTLMQVVTGAQVYRGMLLCEIADLTTLELSAEIDELDLSVIREGDMLSYTLDAYGDQVFTGTITEIRPIGTARQNATYFDVRITAPQDAAVLPGMNATVMLP